MSAPHHQSRPWPACRPWPAGRAWPPGAAWSAGRSWSPGGLGPAGRSWPPGGSGPPARSWSRGPGGRGGPRARRPDWPGGAVIGALLFHLLGNRDAVAGGDVLRAMDALSYALLIAGPVALFWRRRAPIVVLAVASAATIGFATFAVPRWTFAVAPVIALFSAVKAGRRRAAVSTAALAWLSYLMITLVFAQPLGVPVDARPDLRVVLLTAVALVLTVVLGAGSKVRAEFRAEMAKAQAEQARARAEQERRQASEERLRIARELHDALGHHLSLISVQAGVGLHLMDNRPEQAREALSAIKTASAEALREVRAVLGVLRPEEEAAPRQPALGLARLAELTADAGLVVTTSVLGQPRELPAEVDRAAYRIVQEALTNVRRHAAAGSAAHVTVEYRHAELAISVRDDGSPPARSPGAADQRDGPAAATDGRAGGATAGSGIAGMRARAASLGGTLTAGPLPGGGFEVAALIPAARLAAAAPAVEPPVEPPVQPTAAPNAGPTAGTPAGGPAGPPSRE